MTVNQQNYIKNFTETGIEPKKTGKKMAFTGGNTQADVYTAQLPDGKIMV